MSRVLYRTVVADPPWRYNTKDIAGRNLLADGIRRSAGASSHDRYGSMALDEIEAVPVADWVESSAHLYLWTTNAFVCEAHDVARAWGFAPKTLITWGKVRASGEPSRKMGYWYRSATEHVIFAVRGSLRLSIPSPAPSTLFLHRRLEHSVKPTAFYDMVELYSPGPYLDVFSRRDRPGWRTWGDQAGGGLADPTDQCPHPCQQGGQR